MRKLDVPLSKVLPQYREEFIKEITRQVGELGCQFMIKKDVGLSQCMDWSKSVKGIDYWCRALTESKIAEVGSKEYNRLVMNEIDDLKGIDIEKFLDFMEKDVEKHMRKQDDITKDEFVNKKGNHPFKNFEIGLN
jgi:hypothetical protein